MVNLEAFYKVLHPGTIAGSTPYFTPDDILALVVAETSAPCEINLLGKMLVNSSVTLDHALYLGTDGSSLVDKGLIIKGENGSLSRVEYFVPVIKKIINLVTNTGPLEELCNSSFSKSLQYVKEVGLLNGIFKPNGATKLLVAASGLDSGYFNLHVPMASFWRAYFDSLCGNDIKFKETLTDRFNMNVTLHDVSMAFNVAIKFDLFDVDDFSNRLFDTFKNSNPALVTYP